MAFSGHPFGIEEEQAKRFGGYNPAFARQVWAKRRQCRPRVPSKKEIARIQAQERRAKAEADRVARLKAMIERGDIQAIIAEVALAHRVTVEDILGHGKSAPLVKARHQAMVEVAIRRPAFSLPQLGKVFNRDHTTILHALQKFGIRDRAAS